MILDGEWEGIKAWHRPEEIDWAASADGFYLRMIWIVCVRRGGL